MSEPAAAVVIGFDAAVQARSCGLVRAAITGDGRIELLDLWDPARREEEAAASLERTLGEWSQAALDAGHTLLWAVDAPLGWPAPLARALIDHAAGAPVAGGTSDAAADRAGLFSRVTDRDIATRIGRRPLEVGADRIARTAHETLRRIESVRAQLRGGGGGEPVVADVPLSPAELRPTGVVHLLETYPAGWLESELVYDDQGSLRNISLRQRYRKYRKDPPTRGECLNHLVASGRFSAAKLGPPLSALVRRTDDLDAVLCTLVALDVWLGRAPGPGSLGIDPATARREGWIWCKTPTSDYGSNEDLIDA